MQVVVNKTLVSYDDAGSGPVLLCLHGWMMDKNSYKELSNELSSSMRVISVDLPNFGASQNTDEVIRIQDYAEFVQAFVEKLQITSYVLAGHSMGGQIAVYGAGEGILKPNKVVLIAAAGVRDDRKVTKALMATVAKILSPLVPVLLKKKLYELIGSDYEPGLSVTHKKVIKEVLGTDVQKAASRLQVPALLVYGSLDSSTPVRMAEKLARAIPDSKLIILEGEQHWPHQTSAVEVAKHIKEFVA